MTDLVNTLSTNVATPSVPFKVSEWPEIWQAVCRLLEGVIVPQQLSSWIQPMEFVGVERQEKDQEKSLLIKLTSPNDFTADWVKSNHKKTIEKHLSQVIGTECEIFIAAHKEGPGLKVDLFTPADEPADNNGKYELEMVAESPQPAKAPLSMSDMITPGERMTPVSATYAVTSPRPGTGSQQDTQHLDPRYHFDNFVVGASNQFAHASAVAVAEQPGTQYNPLFLYSPPGLGKTHLLYAIGNRLLANHPKARVAYLSAEKFVNELIDALQHRRMSQFRSKYRDSYDIILIDDIQFIAGKSTSEEEFFHTFNALHSSKRQIVVSSDRPPKEIEGLEERVRTRFEWGLIADISPPEIETRIAILKGKAERDDIYLPDDVATFLASHIKSNVRELEGVLIRLQAQASLTGAEISLEMAEHELRGMLPEEGSQVTVESILSAVTKHFKLKPQDFKSSSRARHVSLPRQIAMYLIRKYTDLGFKEIGQFFGGKDHTTILHACNKIEAGIETDTEIREAVEAIQNLL